MVDGKVQIVRASPATIRRYHERSGVWANLFADEGFKDLDKRKIWHLISVSLAELCGTAVLVGLGCSGLMKGIRGGDEGISHLNIVLTFACAISLVVTVFGHISGSHVNPALSLSAVIFGRMSIPKFLLYVVSQCIGACVGIIAVKVISPEECTADSFCVTLPNPHVGSLRAMLAEALLTGILMWVVSALIFDRRCQDKHDSLPLKFGLAIIALGLPGGKYAGASLNPARSFGPALLAGNWSQHWVYWLGPMGGSAVFSLTYKTFFLESNPPLPVSTHDPDNHEEHPL